MPGFCNRMSIKNYIIITTIAYEQLIQFYYHRLTYEKSLTLLLRLLVRFSESPFFGIGFGFMDLAARSRNRSVSTSSVQEHEPDKNEA